MNLWTPFRLRLLPDEERAEVVKTQIAEQESTKRKHVEEREKTKREKLSNDSYYIVRGLAVGATVIISLILSVLVYNVVDVWRDVQVKTLAAKFPPPTGPAPTTLTLQVAPAQDKK